MLEIRLRSRASFQEKLLQLLAKPAIKKGTAPVPFFRFRCAPHSRQILAKQLALGELERLARFRPAVLLALDGAGVAGQEAALLQYAAQVGLEIGQRLRQAVTHPSGLAGQAR